MPVSTECAAALLSFRYTSNNNRPDIVVLEKEGRVQCFIVNVTCPFDTRVAEKETEKIYHFKD